MKVFAKRNNFTENKNIYFLPKFSLLITHILVWRESIISRLNALHLPHFFTINFLSKRLECQSLHWNTQKGIKKTLDHSKPQLWKKHFLNQRGKRRREKTEFWNLSLHFIAPFSLIKIGKKWNPDSFQNRTAAKKAYELPEERELKKTGHWYFILALYASWEAKFLRSTAVANSGA